MESREAFEKNLDALGARRDSLESVLEVSTFESGVEQVVGPRGALVLRDRGVLLGSAYDPVREGEQIAEKMAAESGDLLVAIGFGLGEQFEPYLEKKLATVIVYEPSPARLRGALERRDFSELLARREEFYIATDLSELSYLLAALYSSGLRIQVFPHPALLRLEPEAVRSAVERIQRAKHAVDTRTFTSVDRMIPWAAIVAGNGAKIADCPSFGELASRFANKPAVVVAAGPSLDKQLPLLKEMQSNVLIIAIGQTVKALDAYGIQPDFIHILESRDVSHQLRDSSSPDALNVVLTPDCHGAIFDVPVRRRFVATPNLSPMGNWISQAREDAHTTIGGGTVAQGAVGLAHLVGANPVMLIGQDLAFTDGQSYAKSSSYGFVGVEIGTDGQCAFTNQRRKDGLMGAEDPTEVADVGPSKQVVWVESWDKGVRVPTWHAYAAFIEQYREIGIYFEQHGVDLINCTEGGAWIDGLEHARFEEALSRHAPTLIEKHAVIADAFDNAATHERADFEPALRASRLALARIEADAKKGQRFSSRAQTKLAAGESDAAMLGILKGIAKHEKKVRRQLEDLDWFDALVQPEIYTALLAARRRDGCDDSIEEMIKESLYLFRAVISGAERARVWFVLFEESFD